MKSFLVIGAGRFGRHLTIKLTELGNDVLIVDKDERKIDGYNDIYQDSFVGDCRNETVIKSLGVRNFDICFVTVDSDFQASLEITSLLKENNAQHIVSIANRGRQAVFLEKIGADEVIYPKRDIAEKIALKYNSDNIFDFVRLTDEYAIFEMTVPSTWIGKTIKETDVRKKYNLNILAIKENDNVKDLPNAEYVFKEKDILVTMGKFKDLEKLKG